MFPAASRATAVKVCEPLRDGRRVPRDGVRRRGVLGAEAGAVEAELHAHHADVVGGRRRHRHRSAHRRPARGRREADRGRRAVVRHRHGDRSRRRRVARRIAGDGAQSVRARGDERRVPRDGIRRRGVLGAEAGAVEPELHARDADVVRRARRHRDCPADRGAGRRRREGHGGLRTVVRHRHGDRSGRRRVARRIARDGGQSYASQWWRASCSTRRSTAPRCPRCRGWRRRA